MRNQRDEQTGGEWIPGGLPGQIGALEAGSAVGFGYAATSNRLVPDLARVSIPHMSHIAYCAGCNERFELPEVKSRCLRCGAEVQDLAISAAMPTLMLHRELDPEEETTEPDSEMDALVGQQLHVYHCQSLLGCGGMGRVYLAEHKDLYRKCALKILSPDLADQDQNYVDRFQHEGRSTAALVHPNIVTVHAIGRSDDHHYLEMEFVAGPSLQQLVQSEGALTPVRATSLVAEIAEGLAVAHRAGIVHRDLKPDNVLLTPAGRPKIADFGLAKRVMADDDLDHYLAGTPNFMAPELFQGAAASTASDVYALGVCYFLLLAARFPHVGVSINELMHVVATQQVPDIRQSAPDVSLEMAECLSQMMSKSPDNRPSDGTAAAQLLRAVLGQVRDVESLLVEAFHADRTASWSRTGQKYEVTIQLEEGRNQRVFLQPSDHGTTERLLLIYSICCPAREDYYEAALRMNSDIPHGSLALREIDGTLMFVMVDTYPRATVDAEEVRRSVLEVARCADAVERHLTGRDHN